MSFHILGSGMAKGDTLPTRESIFILLNWEVVSKELDQRWSTKKKKKSEEGEYYKFGKRNSLYKGNGA